jgi:hypothetical protein
MKTKISIALIAVAFVAGPIATAEETLVDHLVAACETDIENFCNQVTPGDGRLLHCMAAHEDKISGQCEYALYQAATLLEQLSAAIVYVANQCRTEIETVCSDVVLGEGRLPACLAEHDEEVSDGCKKAIADTIGE